MNSGVWLEHLSRRCLAGGSSELEAVDLTGYHPAARLAS